MSYYKVKFQCATCGVVWKGKLRNLDDPDPPCINLSCGAVQEVRGMDFTSNRAPAAIGMSNQVKAIDETARIVMEDHKLGDLRSDVRSGETMTPKLPPKQQAVADAMFSPKARQKLKLPFNERTLRARINAGSYRPGVGGLPDVVGDAHRENLRPNVNVIADDRKIR